MIKKKIKILWNCVRRREFLSKLREGDRKSNTIIISIKTYVQNNFNENVKSYFHLIVAKNISELIIQYSKEGKIVNGITKIQYIIVSIKIKYLVCIYCKSKQKILWDKNMFFWIWLFPWTYKYNRIPKIQYITFFNKNIFFQ